jgi:N-acetylneuraminate synthase
MYGSDQAASLDPALFIQLVGGIRKIEKAMGDGVIRIHENEIPVAKKLRSHIPWESHR